MKITFISDTHTQHKKVEIPETDLLIHTGDFTSFGTKPEIKSFNKWCGTLNIPKEHIIVIAGNHDLLFEDNHQFSKSLCTNFTYLKDELYEINGLKIFGSPSSPSFGGWAFQYKRDIAKEEWRKIPEGIDILLTHCPPLNIMDKNRWGDICGCPELYNRVVEIKPKIHAFGHIHEGAGMLNHKDIKFINGAILDDDYEVTYKPITIEL